MITSGVIRFITYDAKIIALDGFYLVFAAYLVLFGSIFGACEYETDSVKRYIEFLMSEFGKGIFLIFVGLLVFDTRRTVDLVSSLFITVVGVFNLAASLAPHVPELQEEVD